MKWGIAAAIVVLGLVAWIAVPRAEQSARSDRRAAAADPANDPSGSTSRIAREAKPEDKADEREAGRLLWLAKVVGAGRHPVPDAQVVIRNGAGVVAETRTDTGGRLRAHAGPTGETKPATYELLIEARGGAGARRVKTPEPDDTVIDLGIIELAPAAALEVTVTANGKPIAGAEVVSGGPWLRSPAVKTNGQGRATLRALPHGEADVRAAARGHGRGWTKVTIPRDTTCTVVLPPERKLTLTVTEKGTGEPIPGATFEVNFRSIVNRGVHIQQPSPGLAIPPTGTDGKTVVRGLGDETLQLAVHAPGYPAPRRRYGVGTTIVPGDKTEFTIELDPPRTIRWRIVEDERGIAAPPNGTQLTVRPWASSYLKQVPASGTILDGHIVIPGWPASGAHGIAVAPDGSLAWLSAGAAAQSSIDPTAHFRKPRTVTVVARLPDGRPEPGALFLLKDQGNNEVRPAQRTNADGRVEFRGLWGHRVEVYHPRDPNGRFAGPAVGTVDLEQGDGLVEVTLQPRRTIALDVLLDGKPGLPSRMMLRIDGAYLPAKSEDPVAGRLVVESRPLRADGAMVVELSAPGYAPAKATVVADSAIVKLAAAGSIAVRFAPPPDGKQSIVLERLHDQAPVWVHARPGQRATRLENGTLYRSLPPGRYRARDGASGLVSEEVELAGGGDLSLSLDLSSAGVVKGRVEWPEGTRARDVRLETTGLPDADRRRDLRIKPDGTFAFRIPGDREISVAAFHALLRSAGQVRLVKPRDDIVLRLEPGPTATLVVPGAHPSGMFRRDRAAVRLYAGAVEGEPVARLEAVRDNDRLEFGGYAPGKYTIWVDCAPFAPLVLTDRTLGPQATDLGRVAGPTGARIRVTIQVKQGQSPPRLGVFASALTEPRYSRGLNSRGEAVVVLAGLGSGRFSLSVFPVMGRAPGAGRKGLNEEVELTDGETLERTLDLR